MEMAEIVQIILFFPKIAYLLDIKDKGKLIN